MPVEAHFFEKGALALLKWDEANLEARLCRALDVARQTLNFFAIEGYTDKQSPVFGFGPEKPAAETVMLIYAASALGHRPPVASRIRRSRREGGYSTQASKTATIIYTGVLFRLP